MEEKEGEAMKTCRFKTSDPDRSPASIANMLFLKIHSYEHLFEALMELCKDKTIEGRTRGAGVDGITIKEFVRNKENNLSKLSKLIREGTYNPKKVRLHRIPKNNGNGYRVLGIQSISDRVVSRTIMNCIEPVCESIMSEYSFGFRKGLGQHKAIDSMRERILKKSMRFVVDADISGYFDNINQEKLNEMIFEIIKDKRVVDLISKLNSTGWIDADGVITETKKKGIHQGSPLSPMLANVYLSPVDKALEDEGIEFVRYADDYRLMTKGEEEAKRAMKILEKELERIDLNLNIQKTKIVEVRNGVDFLGYRLKGKKLGMTKNNLKRFKTRVRKEAKHIKQDIRGMNNYLRGIGAYYKFVDRDKLEKLDALVRRQIERALGKKDSQPSIDLDGIETLADKHISMEEEFSHHEKESIYAFRLGADNATGNALRCPPHDRTGVMLDCSFQTNLDHPFRMTIHPPEAVRSDKTYTVSILIYDSS